jgi:hypothetical protein
MADGDLKMGGTTRSAIQTQEEIKIAMSDDIHQGPT